MDDTSTTIRQHYHLMLLSKSPIERLKMVSRMYDSVKKLAISGILMEGQYLDVSQLRGELFLRIYGNDFSSTERKQIIKRIPDMQLASDR